ncbi:MAG: hypothetical protein LBH55_00325 [Mycoplasmataceae bacterium]|jgi:ribosomal protein L29|nr:hypothetical protein [Mycoplasmataceae bacterium]
MSKISKDLINKSNEELCNLIFKLKMQICTNRFAAANGEQIKGANADAKKLIAVALTILKKNGFEVTIGNHGIALYDKKNGNTVKYLTKEIISSVEESVAKVAKSAATAKSEKTSDSKENKPIKSAKQGEINDNINIGAMKNIQNRQKNVEQKIRKTQGGGQ